MKVMAANPKGGTAKSLTITLLAVRASQGQRPNDAGKNRVAMVDLNGDQGKRRARRFIGHRGVSRHSSVSASNTKPQPNAWEGPGLPKATASPTPTQTANRRPRVAPGAPRWRNKLGTLAHQASARRQ
jgi:hypothetical protein